MMGEGERGRGEMRGEGNEGEGLLRKITPLAPFPGSHNSCVGVDDLSWGYWGRHWEFKIGN